VIGFVDADHVMYQNSLDELVRAFGQENPPAVLQGVCGSLNEFRNPLTRLLSIERRWMEAIELDAAARWGGVNYFGGGQGFFQSALLKDRRFQIDEDMILDDIDLSLRLILHRVKIVFHPGVETKSLQPESVSEFIDQRFRWARGWVQVVRKYFFAAFRRLDLPLALRADLLRFVLLPFSGAVVYAAFAAAAGAAATGRYSGLPPWAIIGSLFWPCLLGFSPYLANMCRRRPKELAVTVLGIPLLFYAYASLCTASLVDAYVLRRKARYSKTIKRL
jgi:cellulose synthase/poly-beta-1,6-N-acetylglucosamine synthase-like glycosyltransferase